MTPRKKMNRMILSAKDWASSDTAIFASSLFAWAAAYYSEILTALPVIIGFIFQIYLRYKKFTQAERHREEIHRAAMKLLREGKIPPTELPNPDFDN